MTVQIIVEGKEKLTKKLLAAAKKFLGFKGTQKPTVVVGFCQKYAIYVHEIPMAHKVGQWKYLETAYREQGQRASTVIASVLKSGAKFEQALMMGGLLIQRRAQELTPVDTSALKSSAFTCLDADVERISQEAFLKSEAIRLAGKSQPKTP